MPGGNDLADEAIGQVRRPRTRRITVARIASEAIVERLADWGVDTVFGIRVTASTASQLKG